MKTEITIKDIMGRDAVRTKFQEMLGAKTQGFITSVLQIVASNGMLSNADPYSIYNAAAVAATLDLPINNSLGFAYIVPYNVRQKDGTYKQMAQFQIGYKGFIQLAQRSGQFRTISAKEIYEGQLIESDPLRGYRFDFTTRKSDQIIGFAGYFQLLTGFEKVLYMTVDEMQSHGARFSKTYKNGLWQSDFVGMGTKTVLKLLLSKYAPLSIEMQRATITDQGVIKDENATEVQYVDNEDTEVDKEKERLLLMLNDCQTIADVDMLRESLPDVDNEVFESKIADLKGGKK
jgi:recombination protein RecT